VRFERAPFDHPQATIPLDGRAPENTGGRATMLANCGPTLPDGSLASKFGPGQRSCAGGMFLDVPATGGTVGNGGHPLPNFLNIVGAGGATDPQGRPRLRLVGHDADIGSAACPLTGVTSQYCH